MSGAEVGHETQGAAAGTLATPGWMRAVRVHGRDDVRLERVPVPELEPGGVLVRVLAAGICATDRKLRSRGAPGGSARTLGHEVIAEVVRAPEGGPELGTRVALAPNVGCGRCRACAEGAFNRCPDFRAFGIHLDGGLAEYVAIPRRAVERGHLLPVPERLSTVTAALLEPLACCLEGLEACGIRGGESLLVIGGGPMGRLVVAAGRALGAGAIVVVDRHPERREHALRLGADESLQNVSQLESAIVTTTKGAGIDVAVVTVGDADAVGWSLAALAVGGRLDMFAGFPTEQSLVPVDANLVHYRGLTVLGTTGASLPTFRRALALLAAGRVRTGGMVSAVYPFDRALEAFDAAASHEHARVLVASDDVHAEVSP